MDRSTDYLFPPSVEDWLPAGHLARFVVEIVERLELTALERANRDGNAVQRYSDLYRLFPF